MGSAEELKLIRLLRLAVSFPSQIGTQGTSKELLGQTVESAVF